MVKVGFILEIIPKDANFFFDGWNHLDLLDIIPVEYNMQIQQNLMKQFRDNGQKALFWRQKSKYFGDTFFL